MADEATADLEVSAFEILANSSDFNSGVNSLTELYQQNPTPETASIISKYGSGLQHRFREKPFEFSDVPTIAPSKLDLSIPDKIEAINKWEDDNIKLIDESADPDYVINRDYLKRSISSFASEARRDEHATGEGILPWIQDKAFRVAEGAVGPFARLLGAEEAGKALYERTQRSRDEGVASQVATGIGAVVPFAVGAAAGGPVGAGAVFAAQAGGEARSIYEKSMEETGDPGRASAAAGLTVAAQALGIIPAGRLLGGVAGKVIEKLGGDAAANRVAAAINEGIATSVEKKTLKDALIEALDSQKRTFGNVTASTLEAGVAGGAGRILGNIATNIGLDENGDITHGAADAFLANAIMGGVFSGAHALLENSTVEQAKKILRSVKEDPKTEAEVTAPQTNEKGEVTGQPLFYRDSDGSILPTPEKPPTFEERARQHDELVKTRQDYIDEPPSDAPITNERGEEVNLPTWDDYETSDIPAKTIVVGEPGVQFANGRLITWLAGKLGGKIELSRNILDGAFGVYQPKTDTIKVLRSLGSNEDAFKAVLAHEIGHFVDGKLNNAFDKSSGVQNILDKLRDLYGNLGATLRESAEIGVEAQYISAKWRPGWDGFSKGDPQSASPRERFAAYRARAEEVYADVFSALVNNPEFVRKETPKLYAAFERSVARDPTLNSFWSEIQRAETDPGHISRLDWAISRESREKEADISSLARLDKLKNKSVSRRLARSLDLAYRTVFDKYAVIKRHGRTLSGEERDQYYRLHNDVVAKDSISARQELDFDIPTKALLAKAVDLGIDPNIWANYEWDNRIINETTQTIEAIKKNPEVFMEAAQIIRSFLANQKGVKQNLLDSEFNLSEIKSGQDLADAFARLGLVGDAAEVLSLNDFLVKYDPKDPNAQSKALADYNRAVARLNLRKESIPISKLKEHIQGLQKSSKLSQETKLALQAVMQDGAFAVRKYLINPGGRTLRDAQTSRTTMQADLGPEKFKALEQISADWHAALSSRLDEWERSGIFGPELMERIRLNKDNYVTANVLKYFEGDENVEGSIRGAIGTLSDTGNELSSSMSKTKAIDRRVTYQISVNAAVKIGERNGDLVESRPRRYQEDIFAERDKLSKSDPDHSYLITYDKGTPYLNKLKGGKGYEQMYDRISDSPLLNPLLILSDELGKAFLTRQLKTVFNPAFVLFQKFYDYKNEAILANSLEVSLGLPFHLNPELRAARKASREEINHFRKTGELTGELKKLVDLNGATLGKALMEEAGFNVEGSAEENIYAVFGKEMPDETTRMERIGNWSEEKLDKVGGAWLKRIAESDELTTKLTGFRIGKDMLGMGDAEAATFARERFGIPDPTGGGRAAPLINRMFLFGVAHFNGVRNLVTLFKDMPKTAATQLAMRVVFPKLLMSAPIMAYVMKQAFGQEEADKYTLISNMIPSNEKMGKQIIVLGAQDGQGNYHNFFDINPKDIQSDWKAWYVRLPQSREVTTMTKVLWPIIENLGQGEITKAVGEGTKSAGSQLLAGVQPTAQYLINLAELTMGRNPTDFFRMKGILKGDVAKAGSLGDKFYEYGKYVAAQQAPVAVPYNPFATTDPKGAGETTIQSIPLAGPMMRSFVGISNFGLIEQSKDAQAARERIDTSIKLSTGEATQDILNEYRVAAGQISAIGKGWDEKVGTNVAERIKYLNSWHSKIWLPYRNELRAAMEAGDSERYEYLLQELETSSKSVLPEIRGLSSSVEKTQEADQK